MVNFYKDILRNIFSVFVSEEKAIASIDDPSLIDAHQFIEGGHITDFDLFYEIGFIHSIIGL